MSSQLIAQQLLMWRTSQVLPQWQRNGLGRGAVERLTASLVGKGITTITLYAEPNVIGMYEKLGFVKDPEQIKGMSFQRSSRAGKALAAGLTTAQLT